MEHRNLPLEAEDRTVHVGHPKEHAGIVHEVAGGEIVRPIHHDVVPVEDLESVVRAEPHLAGLDLDFRVDVVESFAGGFEFAAAHVLGAVDDLSLEVAELDSVEIDESDRADAGRCQVERRRRAEAACPDEQDASLLQPLLPLHAYLGHDEVSAVAVDLFLRELDFTQLSQRGTATCDGWDDPDLVTVLHSGLLAVQVANVFVIEVDVDEATELAVLGVEVCLEPFEPPRQFCQCLADGAGLQHDRGVPVRILSEGRWEDKRDRVHRSFRLSCHCGLIGDVGRRVYRSARTFVCHPRAATPVSHPRNPRERSISYRCTMAERSRGQNPTGSAAHPGASDSTRRPGGYALPHAARALRRRPGR